jgi:hypothetical protein
MWSPSDDSSVVWIGDEAKEDGDYYLKYTRSSFWRYSEARVLDHMDKIWISNIAAEIDVLRYILMNGIKVDDLVDKEDLQE